MDSFFIKIKIKSLLKKLLRNIRLFFSLPHLMVTLLVILVAIITLLISMKLKLTAPYASSVLSNIFAGLITGVVLCLVSSVKTVSLYRTERILNWLESINSDYLEFNKSYWNLLFNVIDNCESEDELYDCIYDVLCIGNNLSSRISQGRFDTSLPFNTYKYCKHHFKYDAVKIMEQNNDLRDIIIGVDLSKITKDNLRKLFNEMEKSLSFLNSNVLSKKRELVAKKTLYPHRLFNKKFRTFDKTQTSL